MRKIFNKNIYIISALIAIFLPCFTFASTVYIDTDHSDFYVGDTIIFNVRINSEDKSVNTVEGNVSLKYPSRSASIGDINLSGSGFSLWPRKPSLSLDGKNISFVGGVPNGLISKDAILFKIVLNLQKTGQIVLTPDNVSVYLNNGEGTKDTVSVKNLVINVLPNESGHQTVDDWTSVISTDQTPPKPFKIFVGQDSSVFDGKKFLSFSTTDDQSNIEYYEVTEGDLSPVRSGNIYVLQEQTKPVKVTVVAYDTSGNARKSVYNPTITAHLPYIIVVVLALFIAIFWIIKKNVLVKK